MSIPVDDLLSYLEQRAPQVQRRASNVIPQTPPPSTQSTQQLQIHNPRQYEPIYDFNHPYPTPEQMEQNGRDWTYEHIRTLIYWMNIANINIFLLDASIQHYKKIVMQVMAFTFLFSSLSTTISLSQLGIDEEKNPGLATGIKYTFVAASAISTILVGYVKLFKLQEMMDANIEMHKDWLEFATKISGELQMPKRLRTPALKLLQDMKDSYMGLFCKRPFVPSIVKRYANRYFMNYTQEVVEIKSDECCSRHNYIKRTNIFFVFQDIMKNEIKRLAGEIEVGNTVVNENEQSLLEGPLAAGTELGRPKLPSSSELKQNIMIRYKYDGPFISIEVIDKVPPANGEVKPDSRKRLLGAQISIPVAPTYNSPVRRERKSEGKRTIFKAVREKMKNLSGADSGSDESIEEYRPRAASFQAPERALYTQMQYRSSEAAQPPPLGRASEMMSNKTSSFSVNQKRELGDLVKHLNDEIVATRRKSVATTHLPMIISPDKNRDVSREEIMKLFPMIQENDGYSGALSIVKNDCSSSVDSSGSIESNKSIGTSDSFDSIESQSHEEAQN
jgi:hypothetical protein